MSAVKNKKNKNSFKKHSYRYGKTRRESLGSLTYGNGNGNKIGKNTTPRTGGKKPDATIALLVL
jgi:hypothetical protein